MQTVKDSGGSRKYIYIYIFKHRSIFSAEGEDLWAGQEPPLDAHHPWVPGNP